jgi:hypothetical protein
MNKKTTGLIYLIISLVLFAQAFFDYYLIPTNILTSFFGFQPTINSFAINIMVIGPIIFLIGLFSFFMLLGLEHKFANDKDKLKTIKILKEKIMMIIIGGFSLLVTFVLTIGYTVVTLFHRIPDTSYFTDKYVYYYLFLYCFIWFIAHFVYDLNFKTSLKQNIIAFLLLAIAIISPIIFTF